MNRRGKKNPLKIFSKNRRGISSIIATLILILLTIVLAGVIWAVISNIVKSGTEQTTFQFGTLFLDLSIKSVVIDDQENVNVVVERGIGQGDLAGVAFVISDGKETVVIKKSGFITELGSKTFSLIPSELEDVSFVKELSIAPLISNADGEQQVGRQVDAKISSYSNSCLGIKEGGESKGDGVYIIDSDGLGSEDSFSVYCDMTTDGGGWTLIARTGPTVVGNFGWKYESGSVLNFSSAYSLNVYGKKISFSEALWGQRAAADNNLWGTNVYKKINIPDDFLTEYATSGLSLSGQVIKGSYSSSPCMQNNWGFTDQNNNYYMRDCCGYAAYGLQGNRFVTTYCAGASCTSGEFCEDNYGARSRYAMIMIR